MRHIEDTYRIGCTTELGIRAVYWSHRGRCHGLPLMFLRDDGHEAACERLVQQANMATSRKSIWLRQHKYQSKDGAGA